jgi:hypothetical protein
VSSHFDLPMEVRLRIYLPRKLGPLSGDPAGPQSAVDVRVVNGPRTRMYPVRVLGHSVRKAGHLMLPQPQKNQLPRGMLTRPHHF